MTKQQIGPLPLIYPIPIALVGVLVDGEPNFTEVGDVGIMGIRPPYVFVSLGEKSYSKRGIEQTGQYSLNFPNTDLMAETDLCGTASGANIDKAALFTLFTGEEDAANPPMIDECPVNLVCKVVKHFTLEHRNVFVGQVTRTYISDEYLINHDGKKHLADLTALDPLIYALDNRYYKIGQPIGDGYREGKKIPVPKPDTPAE
ncbi:flavin reductase family protein [bacterium]|nr:flavin reductase family protein [bacterium]